jgi:hypothetical protein
MSAMTPTWRNTIMDTLQLLIPAGIIAVWLVLQIWVLPRLGVQT